MKQRVGWNPWWLGAGLAVLLLLLGQYAVRRERVRTAGAFGQISRFKAFSPAELKVWRQAVEEIEHEVLQFRETVVAPPPPGARDGGEAILARVRFAEEMSELARQHAVVLEEPDCFGFGLDEGPEISTAARDALMRQLQSARQLVPIVLAAEPARFVRLLRLPSSEPANLPSALSGVAECRLALEFTGTTTVLRRLAAQLRERAPGVWVSGLTILPLERETAAGGGSNASLRCTIETVTWFNAEAAGAPDERKAG